MASLPGNCTATAQSPAPVVAFCIAGSARAFPTPLIASALVREFIGRLEASPNSRSFLLLKTEDSPKSSGYGDHFRAVHADFSAADLVAIFNSSAARSRIELGSATVLSGAGSAPAEVCQQEQCVSASDSTRWTSFRRNGSTSICRANSDQSWEMRTLMNALNAEWCARQISNYEHRHGIQFELVAYSRPDIWWRQPLGGWCTWDSTRVAIVDADRAWITPSHESMRSELHRPRPKAKNATDIARQ